jgi:hypothetical protein
MAARHSSTNRITGMLRFRFLTPWISPEIRDQKLSPRLALASDDGVYGGLLEPVPKSTDASMWEIEFLRSSHVSKFWNVSDCPYDFWRTIWIKSKTSKESKESSLHRPTDKNCAHIKDIVILENLLRSGAATYRSRYCLILKQISNV